MHAGVFTILPPQEPQKTPEYSNVLQSKRKWRSETPGGAVNNAVVHKLSPFVVVTTIKFASNCCTLARYGRGYAYLHVQSLSYEAKMCSTELVLLFQEQNTNRQLMLHILPKYRPLLNCDAAPHFHIACKRHVALATTFRKKKSPTTLKSKSVAQEVKQTGDLPVQGFLKCLTMMKV